MTIDDFVGDVSDIRNRISPHTLVWDLASGEDCSVVIDICLCNHTDLSKVICEKCGGEV